MSILRFVTDLLGQRAGGGRADQLPEHLRPRIAEAIEFAVDTVDPKIRLVSGYRKRLEPAVTRTAMHMRALVPLLPEPVALSRQAWSENPAVNAWFARPEDVAETLRASDELHAFFADPVNAGVDSVLAVLAMERRARNVLGMALDKGMLRRDVAQTTVSFGAHRVVIPARTPEEMRRELASRIFRALLQRVLERVEAAQAHREGLEQSVALLAARLRRLACGAESLDPLTADAAARRAQLDALKQEFEQAQGELRESKVGSATLDSLIAEIVAVLGHPETHLALSKVPLRLDRMGVATRKSATGVNEIVQTEIVLGPDLRRDIAIVRCARRDLPPRISMAESAARLL